MSSRDRVRRPTARRPSGAPRQAASAPSSGPAEILALQRSAGNRAVVQRLVYNRDSQALTVPASYAAQQVAWDGKQYSEERAVKAEDPTLAALLKDHEEAFKGHFAAGLNVDSVSKISAVADATMAAGARGLAAPEATQGTDAALAAAATSYGELLLHTKARKYWGADELDTQLVLKLRDILPQAPDLPGSGTSVRSKIPNSPIKNATYWGYMCVLIAIAKREGLGAVATKTGVPAPTLDAAVQAMHDRYVTAGTQYDDTSSRFAVMNEWGYKLVFSGPSSWVDLPQKVALKAGDPYIFDITGHTVKVDVLQDVVLGAAPLVNPKAYFKAESDKGNYTEDELTKQVLYIWNK